jgi:hypothetical protein
MTGFQKIIRSKALITLTAALALYTLAGFFMAPYLVTRFMPDMIAEKLHRELRMGPVKINPFLFSFQADDVGLHEPDGTFIAGFRQCFIDFEMSSLFRWALVFKSLRLDGPRVNVMKSLQLQRTSGVQQYQAIHGVAVFPGQHGYR